MAANKLAWVFGVLLGLAVHAQGASTKINHVEPLNPIAGKKRPHLDHSAYFKEPVKDASLVTKRCLECHKDAAKEVMATAHWSWLSGEAVRDGKHIKIGKMNLMNNFCISTSGNLASCARCHAGYGMEDKTFDFTDSSKVDCLICHDGSGSYAKGKKGLPLENIDLAKVAGSVRAPSRENCGVCHFNGGGGMGVKHGDLDDSLLNPSAWVDVHMGKNEFFCTDCHTTEKHHIAGKLNATYVDASKVRRVQCDQCHTEAPHDDKRLNQHIARVACQTCHIPNYARKYPTKMEWDWSKAGDGERKEDPHEYMKIKGEFKYEKEAIPTYAWYNGKMARYVMGDKISDSGVTSINKPLGDREDKNAKIWPFKKHVGKQVYDSKNRILLPPVTAGKDGYWKKFDWEVAVKSGAELVGLPYSGSYDFTPTEMYWPTTHMTAPAEKALQCTACHSQKGRLDWKALGYDRDPVGGKRHDQ